MIVFGPGPGPTAQQAIDLQRRPSRNALANGEGFLSPDGRDARGLDELLIAHGRLGDLGAFGVRQGHHVVIEARHGDAVIGVVEFRQDLDQRQRRIVYRTAIETAVEIVVWPFDLDLDVGHSAQAVHDRRLIDSGHRRVADDADVGLEQVEMLFHEGTQIGRGNFLFALQQELHIDRRPSPLFRYDSSALTWM